MSTGDDGSDSMSIDEEVSDTDQSRAQLLIASIAGGLAGGISPKWVSASVYDSAWLAMLVTIENDSAQWAFPDCFTFVMSEQLGGGAWPSYASQTDGILNTMAAILMMNMHHRNPEYYVSENAGDRQDNRDLEGHIEKGANALLTMLENWDVGAADHPDFELLVPKLFDILDHEGFANFPRLKDLMLLHCAKLHKMGMPDALDAPSGRTFMSNLEAFVGLEDAGFFGDVTPEKVSHYLTVSGSMEGSPAATAAFSLYDKTNAPNVDGYLRRCVGSSFLDTPGGVPTIFPASIRIPALVVITLRDAGYSPQDLNDMEAFTILRHLRRQLAVHGGVVGFGPEVTPDVSDTACAVHAVYLLARKGADSSLDPMIAKFSDPRGFSTYEWEVSLSLGSNCSALRCLLASPSPGRHIEPICKVAKLICDCVDCADYSDDLNLCPYFTTMLVAQALNRLHAVNGGTMLFMLDATLAGRLPGAAVAVAEAILEDRLGHGGWLWPPKAHKASVEATAYCVLALTSLLQLPWTEALHERIKAAVRDGLRFLQNAEEKWADGQYVWRGKTTWKSGVLSEAFCLAAVKVAEMVGE